MKKRKVRTAADAERFIRAALRLQIQEWLTEGHPTEWDPVWVSYAYGGVLGRYRIERLFSADFGGSPDNPGLEFSLADLPAECRPLIATLVDLLDEQAAMARVAVKLAQADLETDARRQRGTAAGAAAQKREAAKRDAKIQKAALEILETEPGIKKVALAATLADRDDVIGAPETILKKIPRSPSAINRRRNAKRSS